MFEKPFSSDENENEIVDKVQDKSPEHIPTPEIVKAIEKLRKTILAGSAVISAMVFMNTDKAKEIEGELNQTKDRLIESFKDWKNSDTYTSEGILSDEAKLALKTLDEYETTVLNYEEMPIRPGYVPGKTYGDAVEYMDDKYGSGVNESETIHFTSPIEQPNPEKIKIIYEFLKGAVEQMEADGMIDSR